MQTLNIKSKFRHVTELWDPVIIGEFNGSLIKIAKVQGEFIWHSHENEDEVFLVIEGTLKIKFREKECSIEEGEMIIIPKGTEHLPYTDGEVVKIMLIEPVSTLNTGNVISERTRVDLKKA